MPTLSLRCHPLYRHAGFQVGDFSLEFVDSSVYLPTEYLRGQAPVIIAARHRLRCESAPGTAPCSTVPS